MNFNNINGVWPKIKDYIDSKLGGGTSKYKHMIYAQYKIVPFTYDGSLCISSKNGGATVATQCDDIAFCIYKNRVVFGGCDKLHMCPYEYTQDCDDTFDFVSYYYKSYTENEIIALSDIETKVGQAYFRVLKEGWYINYMGQIYDWKGNIVE